MTWGTAVNTALLVDASGNPVTAATAASLRPAASANDFAVWRNYDAAGRLVREAASTGTGNGLLVRELKYDGASRLVQTTRFATAGTAGTFGFAIIATPPASPQDRIERNFYEGEGRLVGTLDAEGYLTVTTYPPGGQLAERLAYATATSAALRASGTLQQLLPATSPAD